MSSDPGDWPQRQGDLDAVSQDDTRKVNVGAGLNVNDVGRAEVDYADFKLQIFRNCQLQMIPTADPDGNGFGYDLVTAAYTAHQRDTLEHWQSACSGRGQSNQQRRTPPVPSCAISASSAIGTLLQRQLIALDEHRLFTTTPAFLKYLGLRVRWRAAWAWTCGMSIGSPGA